jgi:SAM-dependent methyltransferase
LWQKKNPIADWKKDGRESIGKVHSGSREYYGQTFRVINERLGLVGARLHGKILEIGCGDGQFLRTCRANGLEGCGVNPRPSELREVMDGDTRSVIVQAIGETLPFRDQAFDSVASTSVLEHVINPAKVLSESVRVLRTNGVLYIGAPDYSKCFHEGHYGIRWFPMPKQVARIYLRLRGTRGSDLAYLDSLQFITKRQVTSILQKHNVRVVDLNSVLYRSVRKNARNYFLERIDDPHKVRTPLLRKIITFFIWSRVSKTTLSSMAQLVYLPVLRMRTMLSPEINLLVSKE